MNTKICKQCHLEKNVSDFRHQIRSNKIYINGTCKKCWALDNLRPLSAKQNHLDGVNRTRHTKVV